MAYKRSNKLFRYEKWRNASFLELFISLPLICCSILLVSSPLPPRNNSSEFPGFSPKIYRAKFINLELFLRNLSRIPIQNFYHAVQEQFFFDMYLTFSIGDSAMSFRMDKLSSTICDRGNPTLVCSK